MENPLYQLIRDAFENDASDVFLMEGEPPRIRRSGVVVPLNPEPISRASLQELWHGCDVNPTLRKEADVSWHVPGGGRLRVNLYHSLGRLAAVMRPIKEDIPSLEGLSLPSQQLEAWMRKPFGLVLVTGPTGSGKSTTVAACLEWINQQLPRHIVTLEDPIEFLFTNKQSLFSQREIRQDSESFAEGLRSALRQSPDVLFLGEIRDAETALTALHAAETGHLVISTLHSSGVVDTLDRFIHLIGSEKSGGALYLLASQLIGIISQQLLPRNGGGMFPVLEFMQNEAGTRRWIMEKRLPELQDYLLKSKEPTNCSLLEYLVASVKQGFIEAEVARGVSARPQDFDRVMRGIH
ncbi:type IV pilus twitching motility protein PilT [Luteolibacter algae]|uniref:Type IV pilus twitching motility protein PilT n=1 Tax=Luteolibacter algae TaxID=454151 RepID=A0ABW5D6E6_9BACT